MGKIFYIMGKSASGKDTIYKKILEDMPELKTVVIYTTRPIRDGEKEGVEYYFTDERKLKEFQKAGKVIESRTYQTVYGPWIYCTVDDGQFELDRYDYLMIGTLESYGNIRRYFGGETVVPVYVFVDDGIRLSRALEREKAQTSPKYAEMCRRFLADEEDFKEENLEKYGIDQKFENNDLHKCIEQIEGMILAASNS
ncbi:MAG TPA: guanylate kinase [Candidatus Lachnoclostridium stercoravium]|uniref:Guanylate kinase n=1 Tax=Candidatus Lachnoclostridium stercoravium TaxID=2838633 RepID=A0A9D2HIX1_9FIRM|nr:guanylate kinase [Candidatus Lachnoclostridium stercoravium]